MAKATKAKLFVGGSGSDNFTWGNAGDLLLGGAGTDTLSMALLLVSLLFTGCSDRLTPDQVMIDNFQKNKPAFEELVTSYLQFPPPDNGKWEQLPRVKELKKATGVARITASANIWLDDPYSLEAAQKLHEIDQNKSWLQHHNRFNATIRMPANQGYDNITLYWGNSWKDYFYYPADPKIENGRIVPPRQLDGRTYPGMRVLDSLNAAPGGSECYLRKIEPKWFVRRCDIR